MSAAHEIISALIAGGMDPVEAASLVARAAVEITATGKTSGAIRTQRWRERHKASQSVTERHENETSPNVTKRHEPSQCDASTVLPIEDKIKNTSRRNSERASRGTRIDPNWSPSTAERDFASSEGLSTAEIDREAARFRDYWKGRAGSGGVKLDWTATWQNWVRTTAEKLGKTPVRGNGEPITKMFYAKFGSEELDAWHAYIKTKNGKGIPRDQKGGWSVPTQWPPGYQPQDSSVAISVPRLKSI